MKKMRKVSALFMALLFFFSAFVSDIEVYAADLVETDDGNIEATESYQAETIEDSDYNMDSDNVQEDSGLTTDEEADAGTNDVGADETEEVIEETLSEPGLINYVGIDQPYLSSPDTQKIVVSYGDGTENISDAKIVYKRADGTVYEDTLTERQEEHFLFEHSFASTDKGVYTLLQFVYVENGIEQIIVLSDIGIEAMFGVDEEYPGYSIADSEISEEDIEVSVAEVGTDSTSSTEEAVEETIEDTVEQIEEADASPKAMARAAAAPAAQAETDSDAKENVVIVLDPGHGGGDSGAAANGLYEKNLTLKIAQYCKAELEEYSGVTVYMTRETDIRLGEDSVADLANRVNKAANWKADLLVSIHINAGGGTGVEVYYPNSNYNSAVGNQGKEVAQEIQNKLVELGLNDRGIKVRTCVEDKYSDGSLQDYYGIIRRSKLAGFPGIIVEHAFIDNANDAEKLKEESFLEKLGIADATGIANYFGLAKGAWKSDSKGYWFEYPDGSRLKSCWEKIEGYWYYFDSEGYRKTGWLADGTKKYYLESDGKMVIGWKEIDKSWYYFDTSGAMKTGWLTSGGKRYYLNSDGKMAVGTFSVGSNIYFTDASGALVTNTGWQKIDGTWYYFKSSGVAQTGWLKTGGKWYYLNSDGKMATGFVDVKGKRYYLNASGAMLTGWQKIDNTWYYFESSGAMKTGWLKTGGKWYYLNSDGKMATGFVDVKGKRYYLNASGAMLTKWQKIDNIWYYFESSGAMKTGWLKTGGKWYYLNSDGKMATGFVDVKGKRYYLNASGAMLTKWQKIDNTWYYFESSGAMKTGWLKTGGKWYYLNSDGKMATGFVAVNGKTYYLNSSGAMLTKWQKIDNTWYYFESSGAMKTGWLKTGGKWYYLNSDGKMATGWLTVDGSTYYLRENGDMVVGTVTIDGKVYKFASSGSLIEGESDSIDNTQKTGWNLVDNQWYYYGSNGVKQTGWLKDGGYWYYLNSKGIMMTGWIEESSGKYYLNPAKDTNGPQGSMAVGWRSIDGKYYYFNKGRSPEGALYYTGVTSIMGVSDLGADKQTVVNKMVAMYARSGRAYPKEELTKGQAADITTFCNIIYEESVAENVKPEIIFGQIMKETGYLQFGGDVLISQFNFGGLGATGNGVHGESFPDVRTGIRAQIQHLKAYASTDALNNTCVDNRFNYVKRGTAPYVEWLGIQENPTANCGWAAAVNYGFSLMTDYIKPMYSM